MIIIHLVLLPPGVRLGGGLLQLEAEVLGAAHLLLMLLPQTLALQSQEILLELVTDNGAGFKMAQNTLNIKWPGLPDALGL